MIIRSTRRVLQLRRRICALNHSTGTWIAPMSTSATRSFVPPPTTLNSALERIRELEKRLAVAEYAIQQTTGQTLSQLLGEDQDETSSKPTIAKSTPAVAAEPVQNSTEIGTTGPEPIEISPLVLKALAIKKGVHIGSIPEDEASSQVEKLWEGLKVTHEQKDQLRAWAGL
ncbi:BZ3500_MvSof-1268-A1-R1_Chr7-1g09301 [Microbotryum saponariae]|uniref:BZ3500_MvSof-1268-A1-R1_Chr7-1g09301 protein n=1 Tax=Microbotryum saponariae TaxID=289078 RepID=A0A2X0N127_9BASI|nr:BZ3501_MvSof-1269-A2-R1_Chr7-1g09006 [Microbotryum saponariae]SDA03187.1 BZ3500_MvSof-1268-A1-R1_Chr7-1g09301 [Microbotryum saponariae]